MITESEFNELLVYLQGYELESLEIQRGNVYLTGKQVELRAATAKVVAEEIAKGTHEKMRRLQFRRHCRKRVMQTVGMDPTLWLLLGRLLLELIPLVIKWWRERKSEEVVGHA